MLPPSQEVPFAAAATSPLPMCLAVNPDNMSPASTTSSSTSTTTTAEAVSVVEMVQHRDQEMAEEDIITRGEYDEDAA